MSVVLTRYVAPVQKSLFFSTLIHLDIEYKNSGNGEESFNNKLLRPDQSPDNVRGGPSHMYNTSYECKKITKSIGAIVFELHTDRP